MNDTNNPFPTSSEKKELTPRVKIGGLWQNVTKTGKTFLSGDFGSFGQIQVWPNQKRPGKKDPDFTVYITSKKKKEVTAANYMDEYGLPTNFEMPSSFPPAPPMNADRDRAENEPAPAVPTR